MTVKELPFNLSTSYALVCPCCEESFSANRNDYFLHPHDEPFMCEECDEPLVLMRRRSAWVEVDTRSY